MRSELEGTPFEDLENAKREMSNLKNDIKQFGRDLADSAEQISEADADMLLEQESTEAVDLVSHKDKSSSGVKAGE